MTANLRRLWRLYMLAQRRGDRAALAILAGRIDAEHLRGEFRP